MVKFAIVGLGFISERHIQAIEELGGKIIVGCDIDAEKKYKLPDGAMFHTDWRELNKYDFDYISICTPNYLHSPMIDFFRERKIICEKPVLINPHDWTLDFLKMSNVYVVHQLRYLPEIMAMKERYDCLREAYNKKPKGEMIIHINRGQWYFDSWKGQEEQSGGLLFNIGVHYIDILVWIFGFPIKLDVMGDNLHWAKAHFEFEQAEIDFSLSLDAPMDCQKRLFYFGEHYINLSKIDSLHKKLYFNVMQNCGFLPWMVSPTYYLIDEMNKKIKNKKME